MSRPPRLTCAILNMKPGTAKTTTTMFLSAAWHAMKLSVLTIDADQGASALSWADFAGGVPWAIAALPRTNLSTSIVTVTKGGSYDAVALDVPQMEDHERIAMEAMKYADLWVVPVAPAGIEIDRMMQTNKKMDLADSVRSVPGQRIVLLTRTNKPARTQEGPDATFAGVLADQGWTVLDEQIPHQDSRYRQTFGTVPDPNDGPYRAVAERLWEMAA